MTGASKALAGQRERLLAAALDHVRSLDAPDFSLRELAAAIGTSHRMLVYHFGSREGLLIEIVRSFEAEQRARISALLDGDADGLPQRLEEVWLSLVTPEMGPREKLFFEVCGYALQGRSDTQDFLHELVDAWLVPLEVVAERMGVNAGERRAAAGLLLAVTRGLLLSLLASGNRQEAEDAMRHFVANYAPLQGPPQGAE